MSARDVGAELKLQRQLQGLRLEDVQKVTKIRYRYLEALEEGDFESLPAKPYAEGIIRRYCQVISYDSQPVLAAYRELLDETPEPNRVNERLRGRPGADNITLRRAIKPTGSSVFRIISVFLFLLLIAGGVYYVVMFAPPFGGEPGENDLAPPGNDEPSPTVPDNGDDEDVEPDPPPDEGNAEIEIDRIEGPGEADITYEVSGQDEVAVTLRAGERCWIGIIIDGEITEQTTLEPGASETWELTQDTTIRAGFPLDMEVSVNGDVVDVIEGSRTRNLIFQFVTGDT